MSKITKKQLQRKLERQESRIDRLVGMLAKKGFYDKLKKLDQSIFDDEPPHLKWAAIEEDGSVYLFAKKPFIDLCKWAAGVDEVEVYISDDYDASDWQNSLIKRDIAKELTGSDLALELLKNQRYIIASVSDVSDADAIECGNNKLIHKSSEDIFTDDMGGIYCWAVALNNQGEPLTAAEVGL